MTRRKDVATLCASILVGFASVAGALVTLFGSGPAILLWVALPLVLALALVVEAGVVGETPTDDSAPEVSE
ncbi:hypothetical protein D3D02_06700 [Halobellus sp. Atlit-38R]|uniref:hypothetical protein n=1 Tax=Halobellus TaxID=1073986 RepID=UPI000EF22D38|nr:MULTISPECIES: hypothetical protein [Halobellus]RLM89566.1 hypothetical protein D3D02_06700 [Halobellus sp. Atlit-38R]